MFPWFDKNAIKECRCSCCNSGPLDITHIHTSTLTRLCGFFLIVPLLRLKRPFMLCWQCLRRRECFAFSLLYNGVEVLFFSLSVSLEWWSTEGLSENLLLEKANVSFSDMHCNNSPTKRRSSRRCTAHVHQDKNRLVPVKTQS